MQLFLSTFSSTYNAITIFQVLCIHMVVVSVGYIAIVYSSLVKYIDITCLQNTGDMLIST